MNMWKRASGCGTGTCVEVAMRDSAVLVRDSKHPDVALRFDHAEWQAFTEGVRAGEFGTPGSTQE